MARLAEVIRGAMNLDVLDRAVLAEKLLASLDELSEDKADRHGLKNRDDDWMNMMQARPWMFEWMQFTPR